MQKDLSKELSGDSEDEDVENERKRILEQPQVSLSSAVLVKELTKVAATGHPRVCRALCPGFPVVLWDRQVFSTFQDSSCETGG